MFIQCDKYDVIAKLSLAVFLISATHPIGKILKLEIQAMNAYKTFVSMVWKLSHPLWWNIFVKNGKKEQDITGR